MRFITKFKEPSIVVWSPQFNCHNFSYLKLSKNKHICLEANSDFHNAVLYLSKFVKLLFETLYSSCKH